MATHDSIQNPDVRNQGRGPDLVALWRQLESAWAEHGANDLNAEDDPAYRRYLDAMHAIEAARPTDLRGLAIQARLVAHHIDIGHRDEQLPMIRHIADQLEVLAATA
jgi:hypothetical protein